MNEMSHATTSDPPDSAPGDYLDDWRAALAAERRAIEAALDRENWRYWLLHLSGLCR